MLIFEVGHLRLASYRIEAMDFARDAHGVDGDPITHIEAVLQTLEHAAQVVNEMIERHRLVRAADVAAGTRLSVVGGMTGPAHPP